MPKATADLAPIEAFLPCRTPVAWVRAAVANLELLVIDHANCEKKAAATAISLMHRYTENPTLLHKMSRLAREELRHFEQVLSIIERRGFDYVPISASRYAQGLRDCVRSQEPYKLVDTLLVGALIEARSCERFAALVPFVDEELADFYQSLLKSESRHFQDYLKLAEQLLPPVEISARLTVLKQVEQQLIESSDAELRFHSGIPTVVKAA